MPAARDQRLCCVLFAARTLPPRSVPPRPPVSSVISVNYKSQISLRYPASEPAREPVRELVCDQLASWTA